jgi:hypothetical protein
MLKLNGCCFCLLHSTMSLLGRLAKKLTGSTLEVRSRSRTPNVFAAWRHCWFCAPGCHFAFLWSASDMVVLA